MKKVIAIFLLFFAVTSVDARRFTDAKTMEVGGRFAFSHYDGSNVVEFEPIFNYYIKKQLYIGPKFYMRNSDYNIGACIGHAFISTQSLVPYVDVGAMYVTSGKNGGVAFPFTGGIKILLFDGHVGIDLNLALVPSIYDNDWDDNGDFVFNYGVYSGLVIPLF